SGPKIHLFLLSTTCPTVFLLFLLPEQDLPVRHSVHHLLRHQSAYRTEMQTTRAEQLFYSFSSIRHCPFPILLRPFQIGFPVAGMKLRITSTTALIIGIANKRMNIFPASSIFEATELRPASFVMFAPSSVI